MPAVKSSCVCVCVWGGRQYVCKILNEQEENGSKRTVLKVRVRARVRVRVRVRG
jgi:hypothetical protein